jgi:SOS response regulatory protein OraA/RecX
MASIKNLKKDINYVLGDVIEECYTWELLNPKADKKVSEAIINEAIDAFDALIEMVNAKKVENKKVHFKSVENSLEATAAKLIEKVNQL